MFSRFEEYQLQSRFVTTFTEWFNLADLFLNKHSKGRCKDSREVATPKKLYDWWDAGFDPEIVVLAWKKKEEVR